MIDILEEMNGKCSKYNTRVTFTTKAVEYEGCLKWYHRDCGGVSDDDYKGISKKNLFRKSCYERRECELTIAGVKLFLRYADYFVRTVKGDTRMVLQAANKLHPNFQFMFEVPNENRDLAF